jgi:phage-related tail fiber protein
VQGQDPDPTRSWSLQAALRLHVGISTGHIASRTLGLSQPATIDTNLTEWFERLVAQAIKQCCGRAGPAKERAFNAASTRSAPEQHGRD